MRRVGLALAFLALAASAAGAVEQFRLGARFGGDDVMTEWIELSPKAAHVQVDMYGGARLWDTTVDLAGPTEARSIVGHMFYGNADPIALFEGERTGDRVRLSSTSPGQSRTDTTVAWAADGIFLPRGLLGYELVLREARARKLDTMEFTWFDPQYRTETGRVEFVAPDRARFTFVGEGVPPDEFVVDDAGHITGGELGAGGTVYRGEWLPDARRPRDFGK